jgi:hypothetical protein
MRKKLTEQPQVNKEQANENAIVEPVKAPTMRWPDKPWYKELPQRYAPNGNRMRRIQREEPALGTTSIACPKCGGRAHMSEVWISREYLSLTVLI